MNRNLCHHYSVLCNEESIPGTQTTSSLFRNVRNRRLQCLPSAAVLAWQVGRKEGNASAVATLLPWMRRTSQHPCEEQQ